MTPPLHQPPLTFLDQWLEAAFTAGWQDIKPEELSPHAAAAAEYAKNRCPQPHEAMILCYFSGRALAANQGPIPIPPEDYLRCYRDAIRDWVLETLLNPTRPEQTPAWSDPEREQLEYIVIQAIADGYRHEGSTEADQLLPQLARDALAASENGPPYRIVLASYFGARTSALSRQQQEHPESASPSMFRQAVDNYLNEMKTP